MEGRLLALVFARSITIWQFSSAKSAILDVEDDDVTIGSPEAAGPQLGEIRMKGLNLLANSTIQNPGEQANVRLSERHAPVTWGGHRNNDSRC